MSRQATLMPIFRDHNTRGPPSIFVAQKTGTFADFPIRNRGRAYFLFALKDEIHFRCIETNGTKIEINV